jgi:lipopolysaccharide transport system ATP-binding protein
MSESVITVENLSKRYLIEHSPEAQGHKRYTALRDVIEQNTRSLTRKALATMRGRRMLPTREIEEFWALKNVNFEVEEGEVLGIIGRNGAGKSTLLKILSRITEPTEGRVTINGRVASLLEVGTGFHPELTGRQNIYLNGAILGMTRAEIRRKFDEIVAFAEVEKFLDTPVKRYSSGMYVRLAFAVAAHLEPEILVVDEVLAVGDAGFQKKCLGKMDEVSRREGRTVLFVSHNMRAVSQLTDRAILLSNGRVSYSGRPQSVVEFYIAEGRLSGAVDFDVSRQTARFGTGEARITLLRFNRPTPCFKFNDPFSFSLRVRAERRIPRIRPCITIYRSDGVPIGCSEGPEIAGLAGGEEREMTVALPPSRIAPGSYYCAVAIKGEGNPNLIREYDGVTDTLYFDIFPEEDEFGGIGDWDPRWGAIFFEPLSADWETSEPAVSTSGDLICSKTDI